MGVGDWVNEPTVLMTVGPVPAGSGKSICYLEVGKDQATVAADVIENGDDCHSVKITTKECNPDPPKEGEPIPMPPLPNFWIVNKSEEQFRESGIYTQNSDCPDNVDLTKAHGDAFDEYKLYKKN